MSGVEGSAGAPCVESYEQDRTPHLFGLLSGLPDAIASLSWPRRRVLRLQEDRLRALLRHAKEHSPWHAERLGSFDIESFRAADLPSLPPMTKADLMEHWDAIVTDPDISLVRAREHISRVAELGPAYLAGRYHVVRSSGTSGRTAVMLWDFDGWLAQALATYAVVGKILLGTAGEKIELRVASVTGCSDTTYYSQAVSACFANSMLPIENVSPALPLDVIIGQLNRLRPTILVGFPSMIEILTRAAETGGLEIAPRWIGTSGEPLDPELRVLVDRVFGVPVSESWGSTETGPLSFGPLGEPMRLDESVAIVEPVDENHRVCPFGERSATTLVTNIINQVLPLIRYEIGDQIVLEPPRPASEVGGPVLSEVRGRRYEPFVYRGGVVMLPSILECVFEDEPAVLDYQVRQTRSGVHVRYQTSDGHAEREQATRMRAKLARILSTAGFRDAEVVVDVVDRIDRSESGKARRFVRLED
jgi:phenylacetate-coenzyme A ligase PaaK-like adenylate-forming protein